MEFDKDFLGALFEQAVGSPRRRQVCDLRTSPQDTGQRALCALLPGTQMPIHRHEDIVRKVDYREVRRIRLCPAEARYGCQIPKGVWHNVDVIEPCVVFEGNW